MSDAGTDDRKVALVTGASRGIGRAIAARLAADGCYVVGTATSESGAAAISAALGDAGRGLELRVEDEASVLGAFEVMNDSCGAPLVVVNNAGVTADNLLLRMKTQEWDSVVHTNLGALYRVIKPALRAMMKARAHRQPQLRGGADGERGPEQLRGDQGRHRGIHALAGARGGEPWYHR